RWIWRGSPPRSAAVGTGWPPAIRPPDRPTTWCGRCSRPLTEPQPEADLPVAPATTRTITRLALPALGVLAAEPIYLLFDTAVVGRLGALSLAGLAIGGLVLGVVSTQLTFLSYGTTARAARFFGAGDRDAAVGEGVQATWLALGLGAVILLAVEAV